MLDTRVYPQLAERLGRERGARPRRSGPGRARGPCPGEPFDPRLELAARDPDRAGDDALVPLVAARARRRRAAARPAARLRRASARGDLSISALDLLQDLPVGGRALRSVARRSSPAQFRTTRLPPCFQRPPLSSPADEPAHEDRRDGRRRGAGRGRGRRRRRGARRRRRGARADPRSRAPHAPPLALAPGRADQCKRRASFGVRPACMRSSARAAAGEVFARFDSLEARVGAPAQQPGPVIPSTGLERLDRAESGERRGCRSTSGSPASGRRRAIPLEAWRRVLERANRKSPYAVTAGDLLHPEYARGLPIFVPATTAPAADLRRLPPARQLAALQESGRARSTADRLLYGVALQRLGRARSAEREYRAGGARRPARRGGADRRRRGAGSRRTIPPGRSLRLGPLTQRGFRRPQTVRFHLDAAPPVDRPRSRRRRSSCGSRRASSPGSQPGSGS